MEACETPASGAAAVGSKGSTDDRFAIRLHHEGVGIGAADVGDVVVEGCVETAVAMQTGEVDSGRAVDRSKTAGNDYSAVRLHRYIVYPAIRTCPCVEGRVQGAVGQQPRNFVNWLTAGVIKAAAGQ